MEIIKPAFPELSPRDRHIIDDQIDLARQHLMTDEIMHKFLQKLEHGPDHSESVLQKISHLPEEDRSRALLMAISAVAMRSPCYICGEPRVFCASHVRLKPYRRQYWGGDVTPEMLWTPDKDEPYVFFFSICSECFLEEHWRQVAANKAIDEANRGVLKLLR